MSNPSKYAFQLNYTPVNIISGATASGFFDFSPLLSNDSGLIFDTSDFNAIFNNYNLNRPNSFYQDVDYSTDALIPVNITAIRNNTAVKANTPDSNYTARRVILPRYEGSRIQSANYNFYTPPTASSQQFLNGDTGSWGGDESFGNKAVIDSRPIYFAHFKDSKENYELWDSYTFRVDALIQSPFEDITGTENATSLPAIIKLDGSNNNLYENSKTFEVGRGAIVNYQTLQKDNVDYTALKVGESTIFQGGLEYNLINGSEKTKTEYIITQSYASASYNIIYNRHSTVTGPLYSDSSSKIELGDVIDTTPVSGLGKDYWMSTGSNPGELFLEGGFASVGQTDGNSGYHYTLGASLAVFQSINKAIELNINFTTSWDTSSPVNATASLGYPSGSTFSPQEISNYIIFNASSSLTGSYEDFNQPFIIKRGDEIRVTYNTSTDPNNTSFTSVDFTVLDNPVQDNSTRISGSGYANIGGSGYLTDDIKITGSDYSKLIVDPDPNTLENPILDGKIYNFTVRRRVQADDRVIVFQPPPQNSIGNNTLSGEGYLIPNDFTPQQKRNALTLISQLKNANTFRDDTNINP